MATYTLGFSQDIDLFDGWTPDGNFFNDVPINLFREGVNENVFGFLDGGMIDFNIPNGNSLTSDTLFLTFWDDIDGQATRKQVILWDERTQANYGIGSGFGQNGWYDLYGGGRYGLPFADRTVAWEIIQGTDDDELVKLDYNAAGGGIPYSWAITIYGAAGRDLLVSGEGNDELYGGSSAQLFGDQYLADGVWGQGGNDTIYGGANFQSTAGFIPANNDDLFGGTGNDTIYGSESVNTQFFHQEHDQLWGDEGNDTLFGLAGFDTLYGGDGGDTLIGGAGGDLLRGGNSNDPFASSTNGLDDSGNDWASYLTSPGAVNINLGAAVGLGGDAQGDSFHGVENIIGSLQGDTLTGGNAVNAPFVTFIDNTLVGMAGADTIYGLGGNDALYGDEIVGVNDLGPNDTLFGAAGNDRLYGGGGGDTLFGEADADQLFGDDDQAGSASGGDDFLFAGDGNDTAYGGLGGDTIYGGNDTDILVGGRNAGASGDAADGADRLFGEAGNDTVYGDAGNDLIDGGTSDDLLFGENAAAASALSGNDTITAGDGNDTGYGGLGSDTLYGGIGNDILVGGRNGAAAGDPADAADTLYGEAGNDTVYGNGGNDRIEGAAGLDTLYGGEGDDLFIYNADNAAAADGINDSLLVWDGESASNATIGIAGTFNWSADIFDGGNSTLDTVLLSDGNDVLVANTDDFRINNAPVGTNPNRLTAVEVILAGAGADIVMVNDANAGAPGSGVLYTTALTLVGGDGADVLVAGQGADLIVGGNLGGGPDGSDGDVIYGGGRDDTIFGDLQDDLNNTPFGGNDTLYGGTGIDTIYGSGGNDTIIDGQIATAEVDILFGGSGNDTITDLDSADAYGGDGADQIRINFTDSAGTFSVFSGDDETDDLGDRVIITGSYNSVASSLGAQNDIYISNATGAGNLTDIVDGETGNDVISTWAGADTIFGASGSDVLWGGAGSDLIFGGGGTDFLYAQEGADTIYGGAGWDMIYFGRNDGDDLYFDQNDVVGPELQENWIVVYGVFNQAGDSPGFDGGIDFLLNGAGVRESDHDLSDAINNGTGDMVRVTNLGGTDWQLNVRDTGGGNSQSSLQFDSRDVAGIGLWDNDALDGHVIQVYLWNGSNYVYSYSV